MKQTALPDPFSLCMQTTCASSEPTRYHPEWPYNYTEHPLIRLDYMLMNDAAFTEIVQAGIEKNNITNYLSDHYPVFAQWKDSSLLKNGKIDLY
jgi:exonuclease III